MADFLDYDVYYLELNMELRRLIVNADLQVHHRDRGRQPLPPHLGQPSEGWRETPLAKKRKEG